MSEERYWFEDVPEEQRYWFLVQWGMPPSREMDEDEDEPSSSVFMDDAMELDKRAKEVGYAPGLLAPPWWTDTENRWQHANGPEFITAPTLFTTREAAEKELREIENADPERYLNMVERYGQTRTDEALDNTAPLRAVWTDRASLLESLGDAEFLCVVVDGRLKLREDFIEGLKTAD